MEKIAVDFIREQEGFRIWHMVIAMDLNCEAGTDYSQTPVYVDLKTDPQYIEFGQPTIAKILHDPVFNWWDDYPAVPKSYETFSDDISLHQRILNAAASLEVENLKARHAYFHGRADASGEWSQIWSRSREASWAHVFGRMRGFDQIWYGSVTCYDRMAMENWMQVVEHYPEVGGKDPRPLMEASIHTLVTDIIEVAKDGKSARSSFITPGVIHSVLTAEKKKY